jgi:hypothetical protein
MEQRQLGHGLSRATSLHFGLVLLLGYFSRDRMLLGQYIGIEHIRSASIPIAERL